MIKLCGFAASNYYNKVKLAMLEKGVAFDEEHLFPSQKEELLVRSPMGKVPFFDIDGQCVAESQVLVEYLEDTYPTPPLYPSDPLARAKCRELIQIIEVHLELPARTLFPEAFFGNSVTDETRKKAKQLLKRGAAALARVARFSPFIAGEQFTYADCAAYFHLPVVGRASEKALGEDVLAGIVRVRPYIELLKTRSSVQHIDATRAAAMRDFMEYIANR